MNLCSWADEPMFVGLRTQVCSATNLCSFEDEHRQSQRVCRECVHRLVCSAGTLSQLVNVVLVNAVRRYDVVGTQLWAKEKRRPRSYARRGLPQPTSNYVRSPREKRVLQHYLQFCSNKPFRGWQFRLAVEQIRGVCTYAEHAGKSSINR